MAIKESTIRSIGNSQGTTIPKTMLENFKLDEGDKIFLIETQNGILVSPYDPSFEETMKVYQDVNKKYRNALKELAQ